MVSAISLCFLALGLSAASSQLVSTELESLDTPTSDRRTFKHGKPIKLLPLVKKHKKFIPHVFSKPTYTEIPIIHEAPKPFFKVHRYHGVEVKPVSDISFSTPEPIIETHSAEPGDFVETYSSDHSYSAPVHSSSVLLYPVHEKPVFSAPIFSAPSPTPIPASFPPPPPPKPIFSFVPAPPPQPIFPSIPITAIPPPPAFSSIAVSRPAPNLIPIFPPPAPIFTPIPAPPPPPQPVFSPIPIKFLPPLPAPSPAPVFSSAPVKIQAPILPSPAPSPANIFSPVSVKIPAPILPSLPPPSPTPIFSSISAVSPTSGPGLSVSLPPPQFSVIPSPAPSHSAFPPPAPALPSLSISATPEPEYPYPPSGTPIPSYIKDISLGEIELKDTALPTIETPKYEEVTPAIHDESTKNLEHVLGQNGFFQKIKGWKADKAHAALNHLTQFKQKPILPHLSNKVPVAIPTPQVPIYPNLQFTGPNHPLPLAPAPIFFPPPQFFPPAKYENFPPNNIESPPLLNSYGVPIPHDSYSTSHASHDRLSSDASEEEPSVLPAPSQDNLETQQQTTQIRQEFQPQNYQSQYKPQTIPNEHPVYLPDNNKTIKEDNKTIQDIQSEIEEPNTQNEPNSEVNNYPNHKE